ncbi:PAS domain S-box protein [Cerasibacillus terrae]|uniref:histidine kinase n=1 Tax=Cerasibacillus terrae TaxID=2498845 RepID=A0A5C8NMM0_9BACI|nr:ATP-binding protein [Cerasibacillus terrae]TXL62502.1 PAS domain S-box protein [Cerasibacillus terrae]
MKRSFSSLKKGYIISIFLLVALTGVILSFIVDDYVALISILAIEYIVLLIIFLNIYHKYIKPIQVASNTVNELLKENYRARIHHPFNGSIGTLSRQINELARNLSELSINEQIQSDQLLTVIDNTNSGLALIGEKGYIHLVNRKFLSMFGGNQHDYVGYLYYDVLKQTEIHRTVQNAFLYEENAKGSIVLNEHPRNMYIEVVGAPIFTDRKLLKGAVLVFYDITEFKNVETMRKDFVANVSHELKTPITSITGFAETLIDEDLSNPEINRQFIEIIYDESKRLQVLVDDLLTLSKLEKEEHRLTLTDMQLSKVVTEVLPGFTQKVTEKQIEIVASIDDSICLRADRDKIKQILINLLANAINYTPQYGKVRIIAIEKEDMVQIKISDTGIGIPEDVAHRIFERFYRVDKARSRDTGGTGLGLAIVKHITELHGGNVSVESKLNEGSTFTVSLPKNNKL